MELDLLWCHGGSSDSGLVQLPQVQAHRVQFLKLHLSGLWESLLSNQAFCRC